MSNLFQRCGTEFDLSIDVKDADAFAAIMDAVDSAGFSHTRLWLCHPDVTVLATARNSFAHVRLVNSVRLQKIKEGLERRCALLAEIGIDTIKMHHTDWNGGLVTMAHKFGLVAFGWDAQFDHVLNDGLRMGLDGVYSDFVDRLVDAYCLHLGHVPRR